MTYIRKHIFQIPPTFVGIFKAEYDLICLWAVSGSDLIVSRDNTLHILHFFTWALVLLLNLLCCVLCPTDGSLSTRKLIRWPTPASSPLWWPKLKALVTIKTALWTWLTTSTPHRCVELITHIITCYLMWPTQAWAWPLCVTSFRLNKRFDGLWCMWNIWEAVCRAFTWT